MNIRKLLMIVMVIGTASANPLRTCLNTCKTKISQIYAGLNTFRRTFAARQPVKSLILPNQFFSRPDLMLTGHGQHLNIQKRSPFSSSHNQYASALAGVAAATGMSASYVACQKEQEGNGNLNSDEQRGNDFVNRSSFDCAIASVENIRRNDGKALYPNQDRAIGMQLPNGWRVAGVFDGHGEEGDKVAQYCASWVRSYVLNKQPIVKRDCTVLADAVQAELAKSRFAYLSGTTAAYCVISPERTVLVSNTGDSRIIIVRKGKVLFETRDHKPNDLSEKKRIENAGGRIVRGYVYGTSARCGLALSRSWGDCDAHDADVVIAQPDVREYKCEKGDIVICATDGLWDVLNNEEVAQMVKKFVDRGEGCAVIAKFLTELARENGSRDDITAVVSRV